MTFDFEITKEDYINFNLHHLNDSPAQKMNYSILRYLIPILFSIPIFLISTIALNQPSILGISIAVAFVAVWIYVYPKRYKKVVAKQAEKLLEEADDTQILGKRTMEIEGDIIKVFNMSSADVTLKENIKDIKVYEDMILIYLSEVAAQIVPTRNLNKEEKTRLLSELKSN